MFGRNFHGMTAEERNGVEEPLCDCGECRYCEAMSKSEDDYIAEDATCTRCNGAGCSKCEE